jgi:uroporphyrin-III C-methyltransferase/precorrin-2 dehydrogenase/sirohydrochlorin ferrochelatase/uroporphyrin-III C-methyltransferase
VVRLKGGDPFVFGRGSEEAMHLARHRVPFEVVPGVTAASGISAALGIPLTHRGLASGVRFATGHRRGDEDLDLDWQGLADPDTTLVLYMGLANLPHIAARLIGCGLSPGTPAMAVASGTLPGQRQCIGTLENLPTLTADFDLRPPVLFVVGRVVRLAGALNWQDLPFEGASADAGGKQAGHG